MSGVAESILVFLQLFNLVYVLCVELGDGSPEVSLNVLHHLVAIGAVQQVDGKAVLAEPEKKQESLELHRAYITSFIGRKKSIARTFLFYKQLILPILQSLSLLLP